MLIVKKPKAGTSTCTPLDLNPGWTYSEGSLGSQNGLYQWTITPGLSWNHFTMLIRLPNSLKQNHERWWNQKSKKLWDFCWDPNKVLIFTASLSLNVTIMSTAKYSAHLCVGTYILGWWWWFSTTILWCEMEEKNKNPRNMWCTWWHLHKGRRIYTLTKRQPEANIFLPFTHQLESTTAKAQHRSHSMS